MLSKSLTQLSVNWWGCILSLLCNLRPNYGGGNEDNGGLLQKAPCSAALSAPSPATGHHQPTPLLETPGHTQASLGQSLVGSLLLSLRSCCVQGFPSTSLFFQSCVSFGGSMVGLMATSSKRTYVTPSSAAPRASAPAVVTVDLHLV